MSDKSKNISDKMQQPSTKEGADASSKMLEEVNHSRGQLPSRDQINRDWVASLVKNPFEVTPGMRHEDNVARFLDKAIFGANAKLQSDPTYKNKMEVSALRAEPYSPLNQAGGDVFVRVKIDGKNYIDYYDVKMYEGSRREKSFHVPSNTRLEARETRTAAQIYKDYKSQIDSHQLIPEPPNFEQMLKGVGQGERASKNGLNETLNLMNEWRDHLRKTESNTGWTQREAHRIAGGPRNWLVEQREAMLKLAPAERPSAPAGRPPGDAAPAAAAPAESAVDMAAKLRDKLQKTNPSSTRTEGGEYENKSESKSETESISERAGKASEKLGSLGVLLMFTNMAARALRHTEQQ